MTVNGSSHGCNRCGSAFILEWNSEDREIRCCLRKWCHESIKLNYGTTYAGLLDKIYATTGIKRKDFELNIICRYPISSREYKPIPIKNDEAVELMLEVPCRSSRVYCVEIYLEKEARQCVKITFPCWSLDWSALDIVILLCWIGFYIKSVSVKGLN